MSVLVTGGAGYIGGHMALGLTDAGEKIVVSLDRPEVKAGARVVLAEEVAK